MCNILLRTPWRFKTGKLVRAQYGMLAEALKQFRQALYEEFLMVGVGLLAVDRMHQCSRLTSLTITL